MHESEPSKTALGAAAYRAMHQGLDGGRIFADPLALRILGAYALLLIIQARIHPKAMEATRGMRLFVSARSAVAEGRLRAGVERRRCS